VSDKSYSILFVGSVGGVLVALSGDVPLLGGCLQCLGGFLVGGAGVWHYTRDRPHGVGGGTGAGLGAGAAVVAALVNGAIGAVFRAVGLRPSWEESTRQAIQRMREVGSPEQQIEMARQLLESTGFLAMIAGCGLLLYALLGAGGGMIGAAIFYDDELPEAPSDGTAPGAQDDASSGGTESNRDGSV
jgi:hypothetical protein